MSNKKAINISTSISDEHNNEQNQLDKDVISPKQEPAEKETSIKKPKKKKEAKPKEPTPPKPEYVSQSGLYALGWTPSLIKKFLPEPKEVKNPHYSSAAPMKLWVKPDVLAIMDTEEFKAAFSKIEKGRQTRANNKKKKQDEMDSRIIGASAMNPIDDYPLARSIKRHFVLHVGPTNSGKTHDSLERLKTADHGAYLGPLRLLALEVSDRFNDANVPCSMITGEEEAIIPGAHLTASTIELMNTNFYYDVVVVDEFQMIQDKDRGHNWTKAVIGLYAGEIHLCMAPEAQNIAIRLIEACGDNYEIVNHERATPLEFLHEKVTIKDIKPGDALIVFSRRSVLQLAEEVERSTNYKTSVIYGNLPPVSRREQVRKFVEGETQIVISTDAIGMGLNLPIRRIVFWETSKFDGEQVRDLRPSEIKQIAGRAGRFGMYEKGYVLSLTKQGLIESGLNSKPKQIDVAYLGINERLIDLPYPLSDTIHAWKMIFVDKLYRKTNIDTILNLYQMLNSMGLVKKCEKQDIYKMITCSVNTNNDAVVESWKKHCESYSSGKPLRFPETKGNDLKSLEDTYHCLDLYYQFSRKMKIDIDLDRLEQSKLIVAEKINKELVGKKSKFAKICKDCGCRLPIGYPYGYCDDCYQARQYWRW